LPTTILNAPDDTEVMVLEMGMRGFGEIERLAEIGQPGIGVVTRVAEAHSDRLGGLHGVARAKAELVRALPRNGYAILNADDRLVREMASMTSATVVAFGGSDGCEVRYSDVVLDHLVRATFTLDSPWGRHRVSLGVSGAHMVENAAAALACAGVLGFDVAVAASAIQDISISAGRMDVRRLGSGALLLDDTYNANPTSMRAALDALASLPASRRIAILGVMAEISDAESEHRDIAVYARARGIELVAVGTDAYGIVASADPVAAVGSIACGDAVLVKASRAARLERIAIAVTLAGGGFVVEGGDVPA
jgi:UDP-N-acetylmuramoyl-tripeptide--D-alanyl-D-alanine ligase